jgi:hypothetical protein
MMGVPTRHEKHRRSAAIAGQNDSGGEEWEGDFEADAGWGFEVVSDDGGAVCG